LSEAGFLNCDFFRIERQKTSFNYDYLYAFSHKERIARFIEP
jgi:hypothetical protein